ncbi:Methylsterol monooxygenase [Vigna angularis]|uniref:Methylsterol monooxygenase n=1 Tax=Phaseolus angularis TaxID=3914 RepID=A0A8T0JM41_PHAAN|nr:Methylsterol monooxygenase [Vigna angularis]
MCTVFTMILIIFIFRADFHDYHHRLLYTKSGNYSSTFTYMDWIFGTDTGYKNLKASKKAEAESSSHQKKQH